MKHYQICIIGAGIVGACIAHELSRYATSVIVLDRAAEAGFGVSKANSGIVHAGHHSDPALKKGQFVVRGNEMFAELSRQLGFGFRQIGELVVAFDQEQRATLERLKALGESKGVPGLTFWDRDTIRREEPNLSPKIKYALLAPTAGVVNPYEMTMALIAHAEENGVDTCFNAKVTMLEKCALNAYESNEKPEDHLQRHGLEHGLVVTYEKNGDKHQLFSNIVINAAGLYADDIAAMIGDHSFTIHPRRGEEYILNKKQKGVVKRLIFPVPKGKSKGTLIIPTYDGPIIVGPTADEIENREQCTTSADGAKRVFSSAHELCPAISAQTSLTQFAGLRAASDSGDFIIGPSKVDEALIHVAGIQSPGLTSAPAIAEYIVKMLEDLGYTLERDPGFNPVFQRRIEHFNELSAKRRAELVAQNPKYTHNICRCENISAAEIEAALAQGATTLDGIKFRTRVGAGGCQGSFCTMPTMAIMAQWLKVKITDIRKNNASSWLTIEREDD